MEKKKTCKEQWKEIYQGFFPWQICSKKLLVRKSGIELYRIIAMIGILTGHIYCHGGDIAGNSKVFKTIYGAAILGVNMFVSISGYCRIKLTFKKILSLYLTCVFYTLICYFLGVHHNNYTYSTENIAKCFWPFFANTGYYWFIPSYFELMLFAPLINKAVDAMNDRELAINSVAAFALACGCGDVGKSGANNSGYSSMNFIFIYFVSAALKRYENARTYRDNWIFFGAHLFLVFVNCFINHYVGNTHYNNILIFSGAIFGLPFYSSLNIKSGFINFVAASVLPAYFIQDGPFSLYGDIANVLKEYGPASKEAIGLYLLSTFGILITGVIVDQIRKAIFLPIEYYINMLYMLCKRKIASSKFGVLLGKYFITEKYCDNSKLENSNVCTCEYKKQNRCYKANCRCTRKEKVISEKLKDYDETVEIFNELGDVAESIQIPNDINTNPSITPCADSNVIVDFEKKNINEAV